MVFITTTLFDFLKNFNPEAYEIALQIEDEVTTSPASIKTYATTFLECIVDDMLLKSGNKNINPLANFTPKVKKLSMFGVIKYSFETQLINAYKLRNTAHYSLKKTADEDKRLALELYEKLFHIAWRYFQEFGGNEYNYLGKPKFIPPFRENSDNELVEVPHIERMEKIFDNCIICGKKNNSHYHNLCHDCNNKIEHVEDVINLKNHFEEKFNKRNIVDLGYSKPYSDALIRELLNENLILKTDKSYNFNNDYFKQYLAEIEMYGEIELVLSEFASGKLSLRDIKSSSYYQKGQKSIKPYVQLYNIVSDAVLKEFLSQIDLGIAIDDIINDTTITVDEIISWYNNQLKLLDRGVKSKDFINYNKILIDSYIKSRASGKSKKDIVSQLHLPSNILDFWQNTHLRELDYFKTSLDDVLMDLILKSIKENKTKTEFLQEYEITKPQFEELLDKYDDFREIYQRDYVFERQNDFLFYLNENNFEKSLNKANLPEKEVNEWLNQGYKDFELKNDTYLNDFYTNTIKRLMKQYIDYRLNGNNKKQSCEKINQTTNTINQWLRRDDDEIFINFQNEVAKITNTVMINGFKQNLSLTEVANLGGISLKYLKKILKLGENGDEKYADLFEVYQNEYVLKQLDEFLNNIKTSKYKQALKQSGIEEKELNKFYIKGLQGDEKFKNFSDEFFKVKLENYTKEIIIKRKSESKAFRNAKLLNEDFEYKKEEIENAVLKHQLKIALPLLRDSYHAKVIAREINITIDEFFKWYCAGYEGDIRFKRFSETYWKYRMKSSIQEFQEFFDNGVSEKFFLKHYLHKNVLPEYEFWKKLELFKYSKKKHTIKDEFDRFMAIVLKRKLESMTASSGDKNELIERLEKTNVSGLLDDFLNERGINDEKTKV